MHLGDHPDSSKDALREPIKSVFHLIHWSIGRCMKYISRPLPHPGLYDAAKQGYPGSPLLQHPGASDHFLPLPGEQTTKDGGLYWALSHVVLP